MQETGVQKPKQSWHAFPADSALAELNATPAGLSENEAHARLETHGPNRLPEPPRRSVFMRFLLQFHNVLIYVLLAAALVTAALGHWVDTGVIAGVVIINAVIGFIQEGKAEKALEAIRNMLSPHAMVVRDGARREIAAEELVPGDIVLLASGDKVPADVRMLETKSLRVEEAALTGESQPVEKTPAPVAAEAVLGDRFCMAYSGTLVTYGQGRGVVVATGHSCEFRGARVWRELPAHADRPGLRIPCVVYSACTARRLVCRRACRFIGRRAFSQAQRQAVPFTAVFIDLDKFKEVNDRLGHDAGDQLLVTVAQVIRSHVRESDVPGRLGGDEFALLLPDMNASSAMSYVEKFRQRLLTAMREHGWPGTFSIGVASFAVTPNDFDRALTQADALMYEVKNGGRDRVQQRTFSGAES